MLWSILAVRPDSGSGGHVVSGQAAQTAAQWKSGPPDLSDHPPAPSPRGWRFPEAFPLPRSAASGRPSACLLPRTPTT